MPAFARPTSAVPSLRALSLSLSFSRKRCYTTFSLVLVSWRCWGQPVAPTRGKRSRIVQRCGAQRQHRGRNIARDSSISKGGFLSFLKPQSHHTSCILLLLVSRPTFYTHLVRTIGVNSCMGVALGSAPAPTVEGRWVGSFVHHSGWVWWRFSCIIMGGFGGNKGRLADPR